MNCLTTLGRTILPPGFWGDPSTAGDTTSAPGKLYLTFDDGPNPSTTPGLLSLLEAEQVPATFFLIGQQIARHRELGKQIVSAGHTVGNHSYQHEFMPGMPLKRVMEEINQTNILLEEIADGNVRKLFRPPYGILDKRIADCVKEAGMSIVYWTLVPEDWQNVGADRIVERVTKKMAPGSVIVLHEGTSIAEQTLGATKQIITRAKARGFQFCPLPDLP